MSVFYCHEKNMMGRTEITPTEWFSLCECVPWSMKSEGMAIYRAATHTHRTAVKKQEPNRVQTDERR